MTGIMTIKKSKISEILQKLLLDKGLHVAELARRTNLKQPTVQRIVSGIYQRPHLKSLKPLAEFFNLTVDQLLGVEPLSPFSSNDVIRKIPILTCEQAAKFPNIESVDTNTKIIIDIETSEFTFGIKMPDSSMEPLFPKNSLLIIDPEKTPRDRSFIVVKLHNFHEVIFRQLLIDGKESYIKPLSPDFERFRMAPLNSTDAVCGVLIQARLDYQD